MTMIKLPYIDRFRDRHGVERFYFRRRRGDRRIPLSGAPGSPQFRDDYEHALAAGSGKPAAPGTRKRGTPGTFDALLEAYFRAVLPTLRPVTRRTVRGVLENLVRDEGWGHRPVAGLTREHVQIMLAKRTGRPGAANLALRKLRTLMGWAIQLSPPWAKLDPTAKVKAPKLGTFHTWTDAEIETYEGHWPIGSRERTAFALLFYTGQRISDVAKMSWRDGVNYEIGFEAISRKSPARQNFRI